MIKKIIVFEKLIEILFFVSFSLIFLDAYQLFSIPITWVGSSFLLVTTLLIYRKENIKIDKLFLLILTICLVPTIFNILANNHIERDFLYTSLRLLSFIGFSFTIYVMSKSDYKENAIRVLKSVFLIILVLSFYAFFAQLFNFYEPLRNRPGTGVLGFDTQTNFWLSGSHRMSGTFREPVFLVSLLFPCFLVIHYKALNSKFFYLFSGFLFGLTKSELVFIFILILCITEILLKNFNHKVMIFLLVFTSCFFISIQECDISPSNIECPQSTSSSNLNPIDITLDNQASSPNTFEYNNQERLDTVSFTLENLDMNMGFGFDSTNAIYTNYLSQDITNEMYLINRTLPEFLKIRYLSKSFGTGRYFLTYENINVQNNFLFNLFSIGMFYLIILFLVFIYFLKTNYITGLKIIFLMICISLAAYEDLLPIFGLYLGLMFTMDKNANK